MQNYAENCVLVNLAISQWEANKRDSEIAKEVADAKGVSDVTMGRYWKSLMPKCTEMTEVAQAINKIRAFHYANTLPYMHEGPRVLYSKNYEHYQAEMATLKGALDIAVMNLLAQYDDLKQRAKQIMGGLYNELDYPAPEVVQKRYRIQTTVMPMPASNALLNLGFDSVAANAMMQQLEQELDVRFRENAKALWEQVGKTVGGLLKTLDTAGKSVRNTSLDAARRTAELMPKLNVTQDQNLDSISSQLARILKDVTHSQLGSDLTKREEVRTALRSLFSKIQVYKAGPETEAVDGSAVAVARIAA